MTKTILNRLFISRADYGPDRGRLRGTVEFNGPYGKVELPLDEETSQAVVNICADAIVRAGRDIAENLTADVITGTAALTRHEHED